MFATDTPIVAAALGGLPMSVEQKFNHQLIYYIDRPLTLDEWIALDDALADAFDSLGLSDHITGVAGPIPEIGA